MTAVKNAQMAESPLLLIGGAAATLAKGRGALQDIDQMVLFQPLCKFCATVQHLRDIKSTITRALHVAQSGTPGAVNISSTDVANALNAVNINSTDAANALPCCVTSECCAVSLVNIEKCVQKCGGTCRTHLTLMVQPR